MLNQLLVGRYRVIEVLGEGGLAQTYIGIDQHKPSRPRCAVKLLKPASKDSSFLPIARRLFVTEAEILEKLGRHNQIPQLLAHFEENKEFFIIQEYIEGHTLGTELPTGHCWTENKVILMLQDVLKTLEFVHSYRVIHRDIKPSNLIRRYEDGQIVLIDFGAVKQVGDSRITTKAPLTPKTISIGTQGYMPMEQAIGKPRLNSDIYALGMIGIQALTGIDPLNLQENADGEVIWRDYAKVSDQLAAILNQMVHYHFRDRYQSTTEVLQELESLNNYSFVSQPTSDESQPGIVTVTKSESREPKVSLSNEEVSSVSNLEKGKLILSIRQLNSAIYRKKLNRIRNLIFAIESSTSSQFSRVKPYVFFVRQKKHSLLIGTGAILVFFSSYAGSKYINNRQLHAQIKLDLAKIENFKIDKKYQECIQQTTTLPNNFSDLNIAIKTLLNDCYQGQLVTATELAKKSRYKDAINLAIQIPQDQDIYAKSQELISQWSKNIYQIATNKYQEGDLENAIAFLRAIPDNSSLTNKIQTTIKQWQEDWFQNQTYIQAAQKGLDENRWQDAISEAQKVKGNPYFLNQSEEMIKQAEAEIAAQSAARKTYRSRYRSRFNSNTYSRSNSNNYSNPSLSGDIPVSPSSSVIAAPNPSPAKSSPTSIVCLNKNSRIPKCRK